MITQKEQIEFARQVTRRVKCANIPSEAKELFYTAFIDGLEQVEGFQSGNIMGFCTILDRLAVSRRKKK